MRGCPQPCGVGLGAGRFGIWGQGEPRRGHSGTPHPRGSGGTGLAGRGRQSSGSPRSRLFLPGPAGLCLALSVLACPFLVQPVPACPCRSLPVPACRCNSLPGLSLSLPASPSHRFRPLCSLPRPHCCCPLLCLPLHLPPPPPPPCLLSGKLLLCLQIYLHTSNALLVCPPVTHLSLWSHVYPCMYLSVHPSSAQQQPCCLSLFSYHSLVKRPVSS